MLKTETPLLTTQTLYGDYTTEAEFGKAFLESGMQREEIQLISKCGIQNPGQTRNNNLKYYNYTKEYIIWSVEESLRNLKTGYLDTFLLHRPSPLMQPDEIAEAVTLLQKSGKIKAFGVSNFTPSQVALIQVKSSRFGESDRIFTNTTCGNVQWNFRLLIRKRNTPHDLESIRDRF